MTDNEISDVPEIRWYVCWKHFVKHIDWDLCACPCHNEDKED